MTILLWTLFGMINGLLINAFGGDAKVTSLSAAIVGGIGAISGGATAYLLFGSGSSINILSISVLSIEAVMLMFILSGKAFKKAI